MDMFGIQQANNVNCEHMIVDYRSQHEVNMSSDQQYIRMDIHQVHGHTQVVQH